MRRRRIGIGFRRELADWLKNHRQLVDSIEITAEHFFGFDPTGNRLLGKLGADFPTFVHGLGLSLGTPGPLCEKTLERFARVADMANAQWVSEHIAFTRSGEVDLGHLNPIHFDANSLEILVDHARQVADRCNRKVVLENITSALRFETAMRETEFLNELCRRAGCGLLLDVTNLFINSRNHRFDPRKWLNEIEPENIVQLHVVGYSRKGNTNFDRHAQPIQDDLLELIGIVFEYAAVEGVTLERDEHLQATDEIESDLRKLRALDEQTG
ncbi:MAG: DUF692 family multinuclear iron-containing protein [Planctomycetota bacterium]|nr:DUF692 family multinuclear iron-containing protein [Planctomycetota bacterium]